jgi:hypothetical protein
MMMGKGVVLLEQSVQTDLSTTCQLLDVFPHESNRLLASNTGAPPQLRRRLSQRKRP